MVEKLGLRARPVPEATWVLIRADREKGLTYPELVAKHGVTPSQLRTRAKKEGWTSPRGSAVDRPAMVERMFALLQRSVMDLELEVADMTRDGKRTGERELVLLGKLATTLDKVLELETRIGRAAKPQRRSGEMQDAQRQLIERIEQLKRG